MISPPRERTAGRGFLHWPAGARPRPGRPERPTRRVVTLDSPCRDVGLAEAASYYGPPVREGRYVVVIVDDQALFSQGLALLLESRAGATFVAAGSTTAGEEAG